ncbi:hypothetical protein BDW67DRAFT_92178 [Aspergillus spinulosporus]
MILVYFFFFFCFWTAGLPHWVVFSSLPSFSDLHHFPLFVIIYSDRVTLCFAFFFFLHRQTNPVLYLLIALLCSGLDRAIPTDQTWTRRAFHSLKRYTPTMRLSSPTRAYQLSVPASSAFLDLNLYCM